MTCCVTSINFFRLVNPPLQPVEVGLFTGIWCVVPQPCVAVPRVNFLIPLLSVTIELILHILKLVFHWNVSLMSHVHYFS
jgi:hypothetical protein